jgi:hypothetical protein
MFERFLPDERFQTDAALHKWSHEDMSVKMLDFMRQVNNIDGREHDLTERDWLTVREMIEGPAEKVGFPKGAKKEFLYDIIGNAISGLDVDKMD